MVEPYHLELVRKNPFLSDPLGSDGTAFVSPRPQNPALVMTEHRFSMFGPQQACPQDWF